MSEGEMLAHFNAEDQQGEIVHKTLFARLLGNHLWLVQLAYFRDTSNRFDGKYITTRVGIGGLSYSRDIRLPRLQTGIRRFKSLMRSLQLFKVNLPTRPQINNFVSYQLTEKGNTGEQFPLFFKSRRAERNTRLYYVPFSARYRHSSAQHLRRTARSQLVFVQRAEYEIEKKFSFKIVESYAVGALMYFVGYLRATSRRSIIFYEKFSAKAEEGTYELFDIFRQDNPDARFVIDEQSTDYLRIAQTPGVLKKYSLRYYWAIFGASGFVGTEVPTHLSLLRSNNSWLRKKIYSHPYVFLQHGIIYMKNLGRASVYVKGREGEPQFIIASSLKESQIIQRDLHLSEEQILLTGLAQFSHINFDGIRDSSPDVITVMLTWRPSDETVADPSDTAYVRFLDQVVSSVKRVFPHVILRLVPHPKIAEALQRSSHSKLLWKSSVSNALVDTKLLITDYSSVGYNAFYRGAGVVFYQPDLESYENSTGPLIPQEDEYIGHRAFDKDGLTELLVMGRINKTALNLKFFRQAEHVNNYKQINMFNDGKNVERIATELRRIFNA